MILDSIFVLIVSSAALISSILTLNSSLLLAFGSPPNATFATPAPTVICGPDANPSTPATFDSSVCSCVYPLLNTSTFCAAVSPSVWYFSVTPSAKPAPSNLNGTSPIESIPLPNSLTNSFFINDGALSTTAFNAILGPFIPLSASLSPTLSR